MKEIGGYFELELHQGNANFHDTPYRFNSGRAALGFILDNLKPVNVYVPFYTCDALLEPLKKLGINYTFYEIDQSLEIKSLPKLLANEMLLYINYFDIKVKYTEYLSQRYKDKLICDCTQSYFLKGNGVSWYFNSCRKFFGVPDGSFLYTPKETDWLSIYEQLEPNENFLTAHLFARFNGETQKGYPFFQDNEALNGQQISQISKLSSYLLSNIDEQHAINSRKANFGFLHQALKDSNHLPILPSVDSSSSFYPYLPGKLMDKRQFWKLLVFIPNFWNECVQRQGNEQFPTEVYLSEHLIPIPIDHRYQSEDLVRILDIIKNLS
ncbi:hypothetical protein DU508_16295 [Pedobacter chinensis]|uniref:DegT/DnrJ/EryC1/StrS aminotransferase family protein n=1 Tax=Pedobacter chinensis TaxID=2282421 RepID=A0A369PU84_9SPHI|nr:hypothetical protein [Pedobacter chinensis]RDC55820.1 hypothetical protein DU508_16295 [Pedobacter chinensis]